MRPPALPVPARSGPSGRLSPGRLSSGRLSSGRLSPGRLLRVRSGGRRAWRLGSAEVRGRLWPAALLLGFVLLSLAPVTFVDVPALVDYPNHLARMSVLTRAGTVAENPFYEVDWGLYPNLAMDLLVPPLARWIGVVPATRLFYLASQLVVVGGAMALASAARGRPLLAGFAATFLLYSVPFAWGFVNFELALGLALPAMAAWLGLGPARPLARLAVHALAVAALFVSHLFALGLYGVALGLVELWRHRAGESTRPELLGTAAGLLAPALVALAIMIASGGSAGGAGTTWWWPGKFVWLFSVNGFSQLASALVTVALLVAGYGAAKGGAVRLVGPGPWLAGGFLVLYLAMPFRLLDTAFVDVRVLVAAALILPAFLTIDLPARAARILVAIFAVAAAANLAVVAAVQAGYRDDYREVVAAISGLERGSRIIVADTGEAPDPPPDLATYPMYHAATLAVHYADALVPTLFTYPGKQPIRPRPAFRRISLDQGGPIPLSILAALAGGAPAPAGAAFAAEWRRDFDYVFLLNPAGPNPLPGMLDEAGGGRRFRLYRIRRAATGETQP